MPIQWNDAAELKLFTALLTKCDFKVTEEHCKILASKMGPDATARAVRHRIAQIRNRVAAPAAAGADAVAKKRKAGNPQPSTPDADDGEGGKPAKTGGKRARAAADADDNEGDAEEIAVAPKRSKRAKRSEE